MTQFPTLIDQVAAAILAPAPANENPHHRAILDAHTEIQGLDRQLADLSGEDLPRGSATEQLDKLTDVLIERMAAGAELNALLAASCCCATGAAGADEDGASGLHDESDGGYMPQSSKPSIVQACLQVFDALQNPDYIATVDLIACLRDLPGKAEDRWPYADLNPVRLARLLLPYGVRSRKPTAADGSRCKAYRYSDLAAAHDSLSC